MTRYEEGHTETMGQTIEKGSFASVFVSYSWGAEEITHIVTELEQVFKKNHIEFIRDTNALKPGDSIQAFMQRLAKADKIITVISESYFKSENCMNELLQISRRGDMADRTKAIVVEGFKPYDFDVQVELVAFWDKKAKEASAKLGSLPREKTLPLQERVNLYDDISKNINALTDFLADRLITSLADLRKNDYLQLIEALFPEKQALFFSGIEPDKEMPETKTDRFENTTSSQQEITKEEQQFLDDLTLAISATLNTCVLFKEQLLQVLKQDGTNLTADELAPFLLEHCSKDDFKNLVQQFEVAIEQSVKNLPKDDYVKREEFRNAVEKFFNCWLIYAVDADKIRQNPELAFSLYTICHELQHSFTSKRYANVQNPSVVQYSPKLEQGYNLGQEVLATLLQLSNKIWEERTEEHYKKLSVSGKVEIETIANEIRTWLDWHKNHIGLSFRKSICFLADMSTEVSREVQLKIKQLIPELDFIILQSDPAIQLFIVSENKLNTAVEAFFKTLNDHLKH